MTVSAALLLPSMASAGDSVTLLSFTDEEAAAAPPEPRRARRARRAQPYDPDEGLEGAEGRKAAHYTNVCKKDARVESK